jgi:uncharacterized protein (DUF1501 family)
VRASRLVLALPLLGLASVALAQPPPPRDTPAHDTPLAATGTAVIRGRVIVAGADRPFARVEVRALCAPLKINKAVLTDGNGRYEIAELPAGRYTVVFSRVSYVRASYGQRRPLGPGTPIDIANGQSVALTAAALQRSGVITGRIVDEFGDPMTGARVMPMRYAFTNNQRRMQMSGPTAITNDLGEYRLFGLFPGRYYISAIFRRFSAGGDDRASYAPTYFWHFLTFWPLPGSNPGNAASFCHRHGNHCRPARRHVATGRCAGPGHRPGHRPRPQPHRLRTSSGRCGSRPGDRAASVHRRPAAPRAHRRPGDAGAAPGPDDDRIERPRDCRAFRASRARGAARTAAACIKATARNPAMLVYLDNWMSADPAAPAFGRGNGNNRPRGINENYARELMELHTLGVDGGYTQKDVTEVARAFTGWTIENPRRGSGFRFDPRMHDAGPKIVLGHPIASGGGESDGERVLDILAAHPATARFIAFKLARRLVGDVPPPALVERAAARFRATEGDVREVTRTILTSPEFLSPDAYSAKVKTPLEFVVSALRATGKEIDSARSIVRELREMGMPLLRNGACAFVSLGFAPSFLARAAMASSSARRPRRLIAIFQRGAVDGLSVVPPFGEPDYFRARPTIAIARPGAGADTAIDLDGFFGLHPRLQPLKPLWDARQLAIVHASGSPDSTRSHFDAQDYMESGTPGVKSTRDGWLNRCLQAKRVAPEAAPSAFRAVALSAHLPRMLQGAAPSLAMSEVDGFRLRGDGAEAGESFEAAYAAAADRVLNGTGRDAFGAIGMLKAADPSKYHPAHGAEYSRGPLGQALRQIAQLARADIGLEIAFAEVGGWDTHANQGAAQGQLAARLDDFARAIAALVTDLGDQMEDTVVLTMSEFGRAVSQNGSGGTDHGHGNAMIVIGGGVRGGKVYGKWPGLAVERRHDGRDLAVTTDFRDVFAEIATRHLGVDDVAPVFPGYAVSPARYPGLFA